MLAMKKGAKPKKQEEMGCTQVGTELEIESREPFWKDTFFVFYQGEYAAKCDKTSRQCEIGISTGD